jgi:hypothetical protein
MTPETTPSHGNLTRTPNMQQPPSPRPSGTDSKKFTFDGISPVSSLNIPDSRDGEDHSGTKVETANRREEVRDVPMQGHKNEDVVQVEVMDSALFADADLVVESETQNTYCAQDNKASFKQEDATGISCYFCGINTVEVMAMVTALQGEKTMDKTTLIEQESMPIFTPSTKMEETVEEEVSQETNPTKQEPKPLTTKAEVSVLDDEEIAVKAMATKQEPAPVTTKAVATVLDDKETLETPMPTKQEPTSSTTTIETVLSYDNAKIAPIRVDSTPYDEDAIETPESPVSSPKKPPKERALEPIVEDEQTATLARAIFSVEVTINAVKERLRAVANLKEMSIGRQEAPIDEDQSSPVDTKQGDIDPIKDTVNDTSIDNTAQDPAPPSASDFSIDMAPSDEMENRSRKGPSNEWNTCQHESMFIHVDDSCCVMNEGCCDDMKRLHAWV